MSASRLVLLAQLAGLASPHATDHVVQLEIVAGHGASSGDLVTLYHSGNRTRADWTLYRDTSGSSYTDLARGLVVGAVRDRQGILQSVTIRRVEPEAGPARLPPTGRRDRLLGESCAIRRAAGGRMGGNAEICETADGILLWHAFWYPHANDHTVMYRRATRIERRAVRADEVLPPNDLLALALTPPAAGSASTEGPDHEVEMVGEDQGDGSYVQRRHGRFSFTARRTPDERSLHVGNGAVSVSYTEDEAGRPLGLEIARVGSRPFDRLAMRWEPVPGRAPERLLGETCIWQDNVAIELTDRHYECRTADGITLKTESWSHWTGGPQRFTARRLSRRPLAETDFAPPARALDWASWGITPAP